MMILNKMKRCFCFSAGIIIAIYFVIVCFLAKNIPYFDDYGALLKDTLDFFMNESFIDKLKVLFSGSGEHRLFFTHMIPVIIVFLVGKVNLLLVLFVVFLLSLSMYLLLLNFCNKDCRPYFYLPVSLLLFGGSNLETFIWPMSGLANIGINLLALLSIYLILVKENVKLFAGGILLLFVTVFSNGNGMAVIPVLLLGLLWQKRKKKAVIVAFISILLLIGYFYNFSLDNTGSSNLLDRLKIIHLLFVSFFLFVGNNVFIPEFKWISLCVGISCFMIYLYAFWKKYYKYNLCCFAFLTYLYLSSAMVALGRGENMDAIGADRYHVYASLILICTLAIVIQYLYKYGKIQYYYVMLPFLFIFYISSMIYTGNKEYNVTMWKEATAYNWKHYRCCVLAFDNNQTLDLLYRLEKTDLFVMPNLLEKDLVSPCEKDDLLNKEFLSDDANLVIEDCDKRSGYFVVKGFLEESSPTRITSANLWLIGKDNQYKVNTRFGQRFGVTHEDSNPITGFLNCFREQEVASGEYQIVLETNDFVRNTSKYFLSDFVLSVD